VAHNRLQERGRLRGPIPVAVIIGVVILIAAATSRTPRGISITPAPGWTPGTRGPNWVTLNNADTSAQMRVTVKPAGRTDVVVMLQSDLNQFTSTASTILGVRT
jgi:hypothetical protein